MKRIGLLSDTHHYLDEKVFEYFKNCDEIWHAGDFGTIEVANRLAGIHQAAQSGQTVRGVYGNIDGNDIRSIYPEKLVWNCEDVTVYMTHIGGYPNRYAPGIKQELISSCAKLFICGHSHILKIMYDEKIGCLHINPGAAGNQGWHKIRTIVRFTIDGEDIRDCEVIELGLRSNKQ